MLTQRWKTVNCHKMYITIIPYHVVVVFTVFFCLNKIYLPNYLLFYLKIKYWWECIICVYLISSWYGAHPDHFVRIGVIAHYNVEISLLHAEGWCMWFCSIRLAALLIRYRYRGRNKCKTTWQLNTVMLAPYLDVVEGLGIFAIWKVQILK